LRTQRSNPERHTPNHGLLRRARNDDLGDHGNKKEKRT
jgi:hypothetical protein